MFTKVLVPLDLTDKHRTAVATAADLVRQSGGEVTLLHVIEVIPGLPLEEDRSFYGRLERTAEAHLERYGGVLAGQQVAWRRKVLYGHRAQEIVRYAAEAASDLIILTAPHFDPKNVAAGL